MFKAGQIICEKATERTLPGSGGVRPSPPNPPPPPSLRAYCCYIPAKSHALGVSLTPAG